LSVLSVSGLTSTLIIFESFFGKNLNFLIFFKMNVPFLTEVEITASITHRINREQTVETIWSRRQEKVVEFQRPWLVEETHAMCELLASGIKFGKAWKLYLQHTLLFRKKAAASYKWYELRKVDDGDRRSPTALVKSACKKLKQVRDLCLNTPIKKPVHTSPEDFHRDRDEWLQRDMHGMLPSEESADCCWDPDDCSPLTIPFENSVKGAAYTREEGFERFAKRRRIERAVTNDLTEPTNLQKVLLVKEETEGLVSVDISQPGPMSATKREDQVAGGRTSSVQ
jgi:hypothetical protein